MRNRLLEALPLYWHGHKAEDLLVHPPEKCAVQLDQFLAWYVRQHRAPLAFDHQIPHGWDSGLAPSLVSYLGVVGNKVKFAAPMVETALFDLMAAHEVLAE
jgi:hypothetical protein